MYGNPESLTTAFSPKVGRFCRTKNFSSVPSRRRMMGILVWMMRLLKTIWLCTLMAGLVSGLRGQTNTPAVKAALAEAEKGAPTAQFRLGMMFLNGKEAPRDLQMAA